MGFRDRFYTPATARALLSWRIAAGIGVTAAMVVAGVGTMVAVGAGVAVYGVLVYTAMPKTPRRPRIDPFAVSEPWRQFVQGAQRSAARLHRTITEMPDGPLRGRLEAIGGKLDLGLDETWRIARRGDEIDHAVARLDPTALRAKRERLVALAAEDRSEDLDLAIESIDAQLASTVRLKEKSARTANTLRLTQTRLDELVARAAEVSIGSGDTDEYEHEVEDLVVELESLRLAVEETGRS